MQVLQMSYSISYGVVITRFITIVSHFKFQEQRVTVAFCGLHLAAFWLISYIHEIDSLLGYMFSYFSTKYFTLYCQYRCACA